MISFEEFSMEEGSPIYAQIVRHIKRGLVAGSICNQDEMPSRRVLSALLGVNPNTIQKAYRLLEEDGIIESRSGAKSFVTVSQEQIGRIQSELMEGEVTSLVNGMKQMGVSKEEVLRLLAKIWD